MNLFNLSSLLEESVLFAQSNVTQWFSQKDTPLMTEKKRDCVLAAHACLESEHCTALYENFKKTCRRETEQCKTFAGRQLCSKLRENLKETSLENCQCSDSSKADCIQIWRSLFEDICIQDIQMTQVTGYSEDNENSFNQDIVSGWCSNRFIKYNPMHTFSRKYLAYNFNSPMLAVFISENYN